MNCIICNADVDVSGFAIVAPFILELTGSTEKSIVTLQYCNTCQFSFFSHRYSDPELSAIYHRYRSADYLRIRRRWEPWYGAAANDAYVSGSKEVDSRKAFMEGLLTQVSHGPFRVTVDFGGDEGQFFPYSASGRKIVIDVSDKPVLEGVERHDQLKFLDATPDLVMICHVLEHLNDPSTLLSEVRDVIDPQGLLYIEVPLDIPRLRDWHRREFYQNYLSHVSTTHWPLVAADFLSGISRQFRLRIPRLGVVKQSEHINYFNESSLQKLLTKTGFKVLAEGAEPKASVGGLRLGKLGMVAAVVSRDKNVEPL